MDIDNAMENYRYDNAWWLSNRSPEDVKFYEDKERDRLTRFKAFLKFLDEQAGRIRYVGKDW